MKFTLKILIFIFLSFLLTSCFMFRNHVYRYVTKDFNTEIIIDSSYFLNQEKLHKKVIEKNGNLTLVKTYSLDKILLSNETFSDYEGLIYYGISNYYYPYGKIKATIEYDEYGCFNNILTTYHQNGIIKRNEKYIHGELFSSTCYDSNGEQIYYNPFYISPELNFSQVYTHLIYPESLKQKNIIELFQFKILLNSIGKIVKIKYDNKNSQEIIQSTLEPVLKYLIVTPCYINDEPVEQWVTITLDFYKYIDSKSIDLKLKNIINLQKY